MRALIIGRFQPFHKGHLKVIREIAEEYDCVIVGIGSAQCSHLLDNPFTAGERYLMISKTLESEGILNHYLVPIEDINRHAIWVAHIESFVPPFDVVFTNEPLTKQLFKERGYEIRSPPLYNRSKYQSTEIRRRIIASEEWQDLLPKSVVEVIKEIDGVERLKNLAGSDK